MSDQINSTASASAVEEGFVVDIQSFLQELMDERDMSRADLARAMNVSRSRITQIFSDECTNLTVRLLARAVHALGDEPQIEGNVSRRRKLEREATRQARLVKGATNVVPLWKDETVKHAADQDCVDNDSRLKQLLRRAGER